MPSTTTHRQRSDTNLSFVGIIDQKELPEISAFEQPAANEQQCQIHDMCILQPITRL